MSSRNPETRARILKAALTLLEASRGQEVRMADIARKAGITRQALYLHFATRAKLLIAVTRYLDEIRGVDQRLVPSRTARTGPERLDAFIEAWGGYIPEIHAVARALLAMKDTDAAAAQAWEDRMRALREGCAAAVDALERDRVLSPEHSIEEATDILWMLLSVRNWQQLTIDCGWSQQRYVAKMKLLARRLLVAEAEPT